MGIFARKRENGAGAAVQLREGGRHPFGVLDGYVPLSQGEMELYRSIREAVPIVDAALRKLVRLAGGVKVSCRESAAQEGLDWFLQHVNTGRGQRGIQSFLDGYLDSMLTFGRAVGEIVPDRRGREIAAVLCGNPADVEIREGESPLEFTLWGRSGDGQLRELPRQELLLFTPFQPEVGSPYGVSLLRSMPFLTGILLNIYQAMGMNWERMGNVRFAVVYKPGDAPLEQSMAQERSRQIAREWSAAMEAGRDGRVRDFVAVGDVDIKVIGADNQVLDSEVPVRQILEQLVARTGIPPFLLGLSWSSTERMSTQQADMMTSELTAIRRGLEPVVERICELWLALHGYDRRVTVDWEDINLQDLVEEARAELYREQAEELRLAREVPGKVRSTFLGRGDAAEGESRAASGAARDLERVATRSRRPGRNCTVSRRRSCDWRERAKRAEECRRGQRRPDRGHRERAARQGCRALRRERGGSSGYRAQSKMRGAMG